MNVDAGKLAGEIAYDRGQQVWRNRRDHANAYPASQPVSRGPCQIFQLVDRAQYLPDPQGELLSEAGNTDLSGASFEQGSAQRVLEFPDLHRQGGLRDRAGFCGVSEVAMTGQRLEIPELLQRQAFHQNILSRR